MDKSTYAALFEKAVGRAYEVAGADPVGEPVVDFYGRPFREGLSLKEALDLLWVSSDQYYRVVGVALFEEEHGRPSTLFVRVSRHAPDTFSKTFNPADLGPFKVMSPLKKWKADRES